MVLVVVYLALNYFNDLSIESAGAFGNIGEKVISGEFYRLFTAIWLENGNSSALVANIVFLLIVGLSSERFLGTKFSLFVFICTGIGAFFFADVTAYLLTKWLTTYPAWFDVTSYDSILLGASGAINGVLGASLILLYEPWFPGISRARMGVILFLNVMAILSLITLPFNNVVDISDLVHFYGLVIGFIMSLIKVLCESRNGVLIKSIK